MADVTGPISTLPGSRHHLPAGSTCDEHADRPAVARIQGETDSMGSEMFDVCQECLDKHVAAREAHKEELQWCSVHKGEGKNVQPYRDPDEGMSGPVYHGCESCRSSFRAALRAEIERNRGYEETFWNE